VKIPLKQSGLCLTLALVSMAGIAAPPARAQALPSQIDLHGFGSWSYRRTNTNNYLGGLPEGSYRNVNLNLNLAAAVEAHLTIHGQVDFSQDAVDDHVDVDYVFAEWRFSDEFQLRAGKIQLPFGIYTEIFDVGTVRPFLTLPQAIYGPTGLISEAVEGAGIRGVVPAGRNWELQYDVYGGGLDVRDLEPEALEGLEEGEVVRDALGGRVNVRTPILGLRFGGSVYTGIITPDETRVRKTIAGVHAEYLSDRWWLRGEVVHEAETGGRDRVDAFYVEIARFLTARWQLAALYDRLTISIPNNPQPADPAFRRHRELGFGLNYWFTPEFVLKGSYAFVSGNRFAFQPAADPALVESKTRLLQLGAEFSF
jgi:hypothetical protein